MESQYANHSPFLNILMKSGQILQTISKLYEPENEGNEKIVEEVHEKIKILEDGVKEFYFPEGCPVDISAEKLGILDIMVFATFAGYKAQEQVLGVKVVDAEKTPLIYSWLQALNEVPVIKESAVPHDHLVGLFQFLT
ncbi:glutathione S-transferase U10-like [Coffea arabica]|uniref:Glutathione S-transferase U10-like n=1 Tax=Coffea arabica TaxID=13443 RepID=A0A6P6XEC2_COFAR|nr:glutathione S-transferase U10-like [Coffea arabica]